MSKVVQFGIKDLTVWPMTESTDSQTGVVSMTYGDPVKIPGTTKIQLDPAGSEPAIFYADDSAYFVPAAKSQGYTGSFDNAMIPEQIKTALMSFIKDANGNLVETDTNEVKYFALAFAKETNDGDLRFVFFKCCFSNRISITGDTTTDTQTPETQNAPLKIVPTAKKYTLGGNSVSVVGNYSSESTLSTSYNAWFTTPQEPVEGTPPSDTDDTDDTDDN